MTPSLFRPEDLLAKNKSVIKENKAFDIYLDDDEVFVSLGKVKDTIASVIGDTIPDHPQVIISMGHWSLHDLIFYLLEKTGPADIHFTTWQISERAIRMFSEGMKTGLIKSLNSVLDRRIKIRRSDALFFTEKVCNRISLIDCHAKIALIGNKHHKLTVFSSANLTKNTRIEFYIIIPDPVVYDFNLQWINAQLDGAQPFNQ